MEYLTPGLGMIAFDWDGDLTLDGELIPFDGYPGWHNPYIFAEFGTR